MEDFHSAIGQDRISTVVKKGYNPKQIYGDK